MRKLTIAAALAASTMLTACEEEQVETTYGQQDEAGVIPGLEVSNAKLVLAAVEGNPAAIYMDIAYSADKPIALSGAEVEGAESAEIHATMEWSGEMTMNKANPISLKNGDKVTFEPGDLHVMVFEPSADWKPGDTVKATLNLAGARTHDFTATVQGAGEER